MNSAIRKDLPRLPLDGNLDLTYRCNNNCLHCWLWLSENSSRKRDELNFDEIQRIVSEARQMGCQAWAISGGEPMLREDFPEIFDFITRKAVHYTLNTNGSLITHQIARLLRRKGNKMVAIYGATADVHDTVTRNPGSFDDTMRGISYLKEAGAGFVVQIIPMQANYHQYDQMLTLAESLSPHYRIGSAWLFYSANGSTSRNKEISRQRLAPEVVVDMDGPTTYSIGVDSPTTTNTQKTSDVKLCGKPHRDDRLFASCIDGKRDFHIDPYGQMSFCNFIKDPNLRFDLRQGSFQHGWDEFIPSLSDIVRGGQEYQENCGACDLRSDCRWCAVYAYLEHGSYSAKADYLCQIASETRKLKNELKSTRVRYYQIAGITIQVITDFPVTHDTFADKFLNFQVDGPSEDLISLRLVSSMPALSELRLGNKIYTRPPWEIYRQRNAWVYLGLSPKNMDVPPKALAIFNDDHSSGTIYRNFETNQHSNFNSLTTFPSDQIFLSQVFANRQGCYFHASGFILDGHGLLFVGHSTAGKSTMIKLLRGQGEILCDERIIVRRWPEDFRIHGTWSHGELPDVSPNSAPLKAIFFLEKAETNELILIEDQQERLGLLLSHVVKPLVTADWWEKIMDLAGMISSEVPIYRLRFDKSGRVVDLLRDL